MPQKELERLQAVNRFLKLEFSKEKELQEIVLLAAELCTTKSALITLIDQVDQVVIFRHDLELESTQRQDAFCSYVVQQDDIIIIPDALLDDRFKANPHVLAAPKIRFYAGVPLKTFDGHKVGSLCVISDSPGSLTPSQEKILCCLAKQVIHYMEFDESLNILKAQFIEAKRSEIELRSFFESSIDQHLLLGKNFEILAFNKTWERFALQRYQKQPEKGANILDYIHPTHLRDFYRDYSTALKGTAVFDERNLPAGGEDSWWVVKFEPAFSAEGEIIGVSVNVSNVSKKVQNEQLIIKQDAQLREIALMQSHEFRKPVASILGLMQLINLDERLEGVEEWAMMQKAVEELDHKIKFIVSTIHK